MAASRSIKLALVQLLISAKKADNLLNAKRLIIEASKNGAKIISLPECFNSPYGTQYFAEYAEKIPGESTNMLAEIAKELNVYIIGGSIPEASVEKEGTFYNTSMIFGPDGSKIGKYQKMHLFDINVPGRITFKESEILSPGKGLCTFEAGPCKVGMGICYDVRFPELAQIYDQKGCKLLVYPGAFNMTTGPAHWELLTRARALDQQLYVAVCSPARDDNASYVAWGHSTIVDPWGKVIAKADHTEQIIYADLNMDYVDEVRQQIPTHSQKRSDIYEVKEAK